MEQEREKLAWAKQAFPQRGGDFILILSEFFFKPLSIKILSGMKINGN